MDARNFRNNIFRNFDGGGVRHARLNFSRSNFMEVRLMQADLLDWPGDPGPNVHKNAKDTERQAAEFIATKVTGLRLQALQSLASAQPGLTGSQVADKMDAWLYSVKPRLTELQNMGLAQDSGARAKNDRGRQEVVWEITPAGIEFLENMNG